MKRWYEIESIMGNGREFGYYLWRQTDVGHDEILGKFYKRKWAESVMRLLKAEDKNNKHL